MLKKMMIVAFGIAAFVKTAGGQALPDYNNSIQLSVNQVYQAASNGFINVLASGSYENSLSITVGATSSPTAIVWVMGDDINNNTKYSSAMIPITQGMYYQISTPGSGMGMQTSYGFEGIYAAFYPVAASNTASSLWVPSGNNTYDTSGYVGIGTTTPQAMLDVAGNMRISGSGASLTFPDGTVQSTAYTGTCSATGGDYAESVDIVGGKSDYEPGDVIVIDATNPEHFVKSSKPYSTLVAGIYSTKPGYVGRRQTTDPKLAATEIPMAMIGIVPTKVTTENGPIKVGDLLVTSSTTGYAMKGTDKSAMSGAIVGKALGKLDSKTGVLEVLVSLQ